MWILCSTGIRRWVGWREAGGPSHHRASLCITFSFNWSRRCRPGRPASRRCPVLSQNVLAAQMRRWRRMQERMGSFENVNDGGINFEADGLAEGLGLKDEPLFAGLVFDQALETLKGAGGDDHLHSLFEIGEWI